MSFPAFSGLFPTFIAAAVAAPDEIPICKRFVHIINMKNNYLHICNYKRTGSYVTYQQTFFQGKQLGSFNSLFTWNLQFIKPCLESLIIYK